MEYLKVYAQAVVISFPIFLGMCAMAMTLLCLIKLLFEKPKPLSISLIKPWLKGTFGGAIFISIVLPLVALITGW